MCDNIVERGDAEPKYLSRVDCVCNFIIFNYCEKIFRVAFYSELV